MAYITTNAPAVASESSVHGVFQDLVARFKAWRAYRQTVAELSSLTDRELNDIGITRGSIHHFARVGR